MVEGDLSRNVLQARGFIFRKLFLSGQIGGRTDRFDESKDGEKKGR